jgi:hypothetical protein
VVGGETLIGSRGGTGIFALRGVWERKAWGKIRRHGSRPAARAGEGRADDGAKSEFRALCRSLGNSSLFAPEGELFCDSPAPGNDRLCYRGDLASPEIPLADNFYEHSTYNQVHAG